MIKRIYAGTTIMEEDEDEFFELTESADKGKHEEVEIPIC